jgi:hypothetical protein
MDALVTGSRDLLRRAPGLILEGTPNILSAQEAASLGGLFLRSRGEYSQTPRKRGIIDWKSGEDFYQALAITLLPSSRLWLGATLPRNARDIYDHAFDVHAALAQSITSQVARALRARDHVQIQRRGELSSDTALEIASRFDYALICLHGAFDTLAELCAEVYGQTKRRTDSWQRAEWVKKLGRNPATQSVAAAADCQEVRRTLRLLGELRNTVHGPTLQPRINTTARERRVLLLVPPTRISAFRDTLLSWSGVPETWWGARYHHRGPIEFHEDLGSYTVSYPSGSEYPVVEISIDPGICLERLLVFGLEALEQLASSIDWSQLGGLGFLPLSRRFGDSSVEERLRLLGGVFL